MDAQAERSKPQMLAEAEARVRAALTPGDPARADDAAGFVGRFYARIAPEDIAARDGAALAGAALSLYAFAAKRRGPGAEVRVINPRPGQDGWSCPHTVVEIVNDDMPFLVDSVAAFFHGRRATVHILIHPIVQALRDSSGELIGLAASDAKDARRESWMHVEVDTVSSPDEQAIIRDGLLQVLADVRAATNDWPAMRARLVDIAAAMASRADARKSRDAEHEEDVAFLRWLADDHFTFLGFREYAFSGSGDTVRSRAVPDSGLGVLRDPKAPIFHEEVDGTRLPPDVRALLARPGALMISKANRRATVHRPVHMDTIGIKRLDSSGKAVGEYRFVGLFTSNVYTLSPRSIPVLSLKIARALDRAGVEPGSHDGKALVNVLETYPRDELFQIGEDDLLRTALGILSLEERRRIALFMRRDAFERFVSCLVFVPKDRYTSDLRLKIETVLCDALAGTISARYTDFGDAPLARIHLIVKTTPGKVPTVDEAAIEARLMKAARTFSDDLRDALAAAHGEERGLALFARFGDAFPSGYRERFDAEVAVADIARMDAAMAAGVAFDLYRPADATPAAIRLKLFRVGSPVPLSEIVPVAENFGLKVLDERPFEIRPAGVAGAAAVHIHDLGLIAANAIDLASRKRAIEDAFGAIWRRDAENDGFNRLAIAAGLTWREVVVIRAYSRFLRQAQAPFSLAYMEEAFVHNPAFARTFCDLFAARFDPDGEDKREERESALAAKFQSDLDAVASLDEDRILRRFVNTLRATMRTNVYQRDENGGPKPYLALKIASRGLDALPAPRPMAEIFVYSPRMEGVHLRGGKVARGGIRWSDRREDFRTEILGLMKAQTVKNTVIVPVGSKGGFVLKRPPPADAGREAIQAEGIACYRILMCGLLDLTDNLNGATVIPPERVVRHDDDDPYLVVAADKGTATFSDIANGIARDYGYWLDDAFASGGSVGYDHKKMGITARGAWESVKRHFRELGRNIQAEDFTAVGVGDMSGDVFGNGVLQSHHTRLVAAFDHRHIFVDPDPDPEASFIERERMFALPRSSWADYDRAAISKGGAVFERSAKSCVLSAEAKAALGIDADSLPPADLVRAILKAPVDLLWLGGIGTFVKASDESHAAAGDRTNDATRVDARDLRCKVVGEGANLGFTQLGRIEYCRGGGRLNPDFIDNSAGVDTSDHEVNIKIALGDAVGGGALTMDARNRLLVEMTDEVGTLVLRDNYLQTQAISVAEASAPALLDSHRRLVVALEKAGRLDRALETLPADDAFQALARAHLGLTRPEIAVLLAYAKLWLYDEILGSDLPDDSALAGDLARYFPTAMRDRFKVEIDRHKLRREIIATSATNSVVNRVGPSFIHEMADRTGVSAADVARAYIVARDAFSLRDVWEAIEALDNMAPAQAQTQMIQDTVALLERVVAGLLLSLPHPIAIGPATAALKPSVTALATALPDSLSADGHAAFDRRRQALIEAGVPDGLASRAAAIPFLGAAPDVSRIAERTGSPPVAASAIYFAAGGTLGLEWLRERAQAIVPDTDWQRQAVSSLVGTFHALQADAAGAALPAGGIDAWLARLGPKAARTRSLIDEMRGASTVDIAMLTVAAQSLRQLVSD
jgi:glutamate dehydrogenase